MGKFSTKIAGVIAIITILAGAVQSLADGNPLTQPDWNLVIAQVTAAIGVMISRPNNVTSEEAGAVPTPPTKPGYPAFPTLKP